MPHADVIYQKRDKEFYGEKTIRSTQFDIDMRSFLEEMMCICKFKTNASYVEESELFHEHWQFAATYVVYHHLHAGGVRWIVDREEGKEATVNSVIECLVELNKDQVLAKILVDPRV